MRWTANPDARACENGVVSSASASAQHAWEEDVLQRVALACLAGDERHAIPSRAPRTWNDFAHLGFRRIFLSDEWPRRETRLILMFSHEDLPHVVLACAYPLVGGPGQRTDETASHILRDFQDRVLHGLGPYSAHEAGGHDLSPAVVADGPRLQWLTPTE